MAKSTNDWFDDIKKIVDDNDYLNPDIRHGQGDVELWIHSLKHPNSGSQGDAKRSNKRVRNTKSSWVQRYGYATLRNKQDGLVIMFKSGVYCFYPVPESYYYQMDAADSKGEWVHDALVRKITYDIIHC